MGNQKEYVPSGGFTQYLYTHNEGDTIRDGNISAKVVYRKGTKDYHESLPAHSKTSEMYFGMRHDGRTGQNHIDQLRFYKNRMAYMDFDWGHDHIVTSGPNKGKIYPKGTVHVQFFKIINGHPVRDSGHIRMLNNAEIKKYGAFLRKADPNIKFR